MLVLERENSMNIKEIANACNGDIICGDENAEVKGFSKDTRTILAGYIYVGIKGENLDGNSYYLEALDKGAVACIIEEHFKDKLELENIKENAIIIVKDSIKALQDIAKYRREQYNIPVVAVTGSVGKTSTKDIIASGLSKKYRVLKTEGNNNNHIGLPLTILKLENQNAMVVEMGMNHFGEIRVLTNIAKPSICVISNIGTAHIGILGSRENILKAKLEILEGMQEGGTVVINNDNDLLHKWAEKNKKNYNIVTFGIENHSDYMAYEIKEYEDRVEYKTNIRGKEYEVKVPVPGKNFVYNSLSAVAVGLLCDIEPEPIIQGIEDFELTKKRMEIIKKNGITIINDSYNASYDSMKSGLEYLRTLTGKRKIAVLGDMLELGDFSKELHEKVGEEVVKNEIDILVTVGTFSKHIANIAKQKGVDTVLSFDNNVEAGEYLLKCIKEGDVILLKASNSMKFGEILETITK